MENDNMVAEAGKLIEEAYRKVFEENVSNDSNKVSDNRKEICIDANKNDVTESYEGSAAVGETI